LGATEQTAMAHCRQTEPPKLVGTLIALNAEPVAGVVVVAVVNGQERLFSQRLACPNCGASVPQLEPRSFSFNSPFGACPVCDGLGANGSNCHAQVTGTVASNSWGFGINCPLNANWSATDISMYDGRAFYYRRDGTAARVAFIQSDIPDSNFGCNIPDTTAWKLYQVPFTSLTHASFGTQTGTWTAKNIEAMQFQAGGAYGGSAAYRELDVDYVYLYKNTPTPTRTPLPTSTSTPYFSPTPTTTITATPVPVINTDINKIYVFPTSFNAAAGDKNICFNNMTPDSRVQIYDLRGELVYTGKSDNGKPVCWDLGGLMRNKRAASGLYIYVATDDKGAKVQGKLTVVK